MLQSANDVLFEKDQKVMSFLFGAKKRTKKKHPPNQAFPIWKDVNSGLQKPTNLSGGW